jgi:hypothetical protein
MNYKDINDKWKSFLLENTFKEEIIIDPNQQKKKKKKKKEKNAEKKKEGDKEIITNEWEEFDEWALTNNSEQESKSAGYNDAVDSVEENKEELEEMSAMSGGAVEGYAGASPFMSKKAFKKRWS